MVPLANKVAFIRTQSQESVCNRKCLGYKERKWLDKGKAPQGRPKVTFLGEESPFPPETKLPEVLQALTGTPSITFLYLFILLCVFACFACMHVRATCDCRIPWNWGYRWLEATMWMLGTEPRFSVRVTSALNFWAFSRVFFLLSLSTYIINVLH